MKGRPTTELKSPASASAKSAALSQIVGTKRGTTSLIDLADRCD